MRTFTIVIMLVITAASSVFAQANPSKVPLDKFLETVEMTRDQAGAITFLSHGTPLDRVPPVSVAAGALNLRTFQASNQFGAGFYIAETDYTRSVVFKTWDGIIDRVVDVRIVLLCGGGTESCRRTLEKTLLGESFGVTPMFYGGYEKGNLNLNLLYMLR